MANTFFSSVLFAIIDLSFWFLDTWVISLIACLLTINCLEWNGMEWIGLHVQGSFIFVFRFCTYFKVYDADFYEHFEAWCKKYGKTYSSEEHKRYRFKLFKDNYPIKPPHKNDLSLQFLNENAADDHPNGSSLPLDIKDAIHKYGFGLSKYMCDIPAQPGTIYLHNNGNPLTV
jgi:hypothetical protein